MLHFTYHIALKKALHGCVHVAFSIAQSCIALFEMHCLICYIVIRLLVLQYIYGPALSSHFIEHVASYNSSRLHRLIKSVAIVIAVGSHCCMSVYTLHHRHHRACCTLSYLVASSIRCCIVFQILLHYAVL